MTKKNRGLGPLGMDRLERALLKLPNGADSGVLGQRTGYTRASASKGLGDLFRAGRALYFRGGYGTVTWFHVNFAANLELLRAANKAKLAESTKNRLSTEERYARFLSFEDAPVHRVLPVHLAPPLRPAGPSSVWGLAA